MYFIKLIVHDNEPSNQLSFSISNKIENKNKKYDWFKYDIYKKLRNDIYANLNSKYAIKKEI